MNEVEAGMSVWPFVFIIGGLAFVVLGVIGSMVLRTAVRANEVHIVQSRNARVSYGRSDAITDENGNVSKGKGNAYWAWPEWVPFIGVQVTRLPLAVFDLDLPHYEAYDVGKVPFVVDVKAFFRIQDSNLASERVKDMAELGKQVLAILQGAVRKILAKHEVEEIMMERSKFGEMFTQETADSLAEWGVVNVKNIELMDVRDAPGSETISNIMAKKESLIERESRVEVAANKQVAATKEIEAQREVDVAKQEAAQKVGERTALKEQKIGIANEHAQQEIKEQARLTAEKDMAVKQVNDVRSATIAKEVRVVKAEEQKQVDIVESEGDKQKQILVADGQKQAEMLRAEGIERVGEAEGSAKRAIGLAGVAPDIALAEEIGENEGYQKYLIEIRVQDRHEAVGKETAKALQNADVKVISNAGDVQGGVNNVLDLFTSKGGTGVGAALEGLSNTPAGKALLSKFGVDADNSAA